MVSIYSKKVDGTWFGLAYIEQRILATAVDSSKEKTVGSLLRNIQVEVKSQIVEESSEFAERTILMLKELETGNEENKVFSLATECLPEPLAEVLKAASAIPIGYVTSYGNIAKMVGTEPRIVGRIMASNPLYPIVPCHRVVGADFSLVGYGGRKNLPALQAKLARLSKEARGFTKEIEVLVEGRRLLVYPVEFVIKKAEKHDLGFSRQRRLFGN